MGEPDDDPKSLERRCGSCARFVRVIETIDDTGEVKRKGECLLGVWPAPLYDNNTCSQWVRKGEFKARPAGAPARTRPARPEGPARSPASAGSRSYEEASHGSHALDVTLPEELLDMDANEFRRVLRFVIRDELGVGDVALAGKWEGGEIILKPGKEGMQEKRIPIDALFHKVVMIRDKLRVLEQKINTNPKLAADDKVQLQQYVTGCYGSLTTFNVLFADRDDQFVGQKSDE
jgi:hypothetical protein